MATVTVTSRSSAATIDAALAGTVGIPHRVVAHPNASPEAHRLVADRILAALNGDNPVNIVEPWLRNWAGRMIDPEGPASVHLTDEQRSGLLLSAL